MSLKIEAISVWKELKNTTEPIIMYGTGNGADKVLDVLCAKGVEIQGVMASNSFVRSRSFRGFQVMPLSHFEEKYESFTVIVTFGTSVPEVMDNIYKIAEKHRVLIPVVPVIGTEIFDEDFLNIHRAQLEEAYNLMADAFSKKIFSGYVNFLYGGRLADLKEITTAEEEAFRNILRLNECETYIDIGAYRGDTVEKFLQHTNGNYKEIIYAEPDTKSFNKLILNCEGLCNFKAHNVAVADIDGEIGFSNLHGRQSAVGGDSLTPCVTLPTLCGEAVPTYIKIDSEGCENEILTAGANILSQHKPRMNIALYHKCSDIFTIPLLLKKINPEYKLHLRHHPYIPAWDTLLYAE